MCFPVHCFIGSKILCRENILLACFPSPGVSGKGYKIEERRKVKGETWARAMETGERFGYGKAMHEKNACVSHTGRSPLNFFSLDTSIKVPLLANCAKAATSMICSWRNSVQDLEKLISLFCISSLLCYLVWLSPLRQRLYVCISCLWHLA